MFTHLHLHTEYSLLDGACRISGLMERVKALGMESVAITDHGAMFGVVDFYRAAKQNGIHPIIGCEIYVCADMNDRGAGTRESSHLILLCENQTGYRNLVKLASEAFTRGFYYRPRVDYALLKKHSEGLIALTACLSGDIPKCLLDGREEDARKYADRYIDIFGKDNFFIELQDHGMTEQKRILPSLIRLAREKGLGLVATNDCHYLEREDADAQEILMCIQTGKTLSDENRMRMNTDQLYVKSEAEMREVFQNFPEAIENTNVIAKRCNVEFDFNTTHLPRYPLPEGESDNAAYLRSLCEKGIVRRYAEVTDEIRQRLDYELGVIERMGYVDYFLIVWDFIDYARKNDIIVGPGRGSGAGSIVAYSLNITSVDPLKYGLVFERFLNPERISMPDIDVDFDYERRGEVIAYVERRYGHDHVAQIITFTTMAARAVIRDVGRVLDLSYQETDAIAKMVPFELNMTLERALSISGQLRKAYEEDEHVKRLIDAARKLEGMPRNASTHAAGVLITGEPVSDYVPLQTNDEVITTQYPMNTLEALGLLKMDFLGLRTLNVIGDTLDMLKQQGEPDGNMTPEDIPMDDANVYDMISQGDTDGVFQLESAGMRQFLSNMKPRDFEDIIAAISLYRPGPMESIPRYIRGKQDPASVTYSTPLLKPILDVTYGCVVYQEQVMQIVRDVAGYSLGRSDLVRRAMSKKKHDVMAKEKHNFIYGLEENGEVIVPGAIKNGVPANVAERIFDEMTAFASYAFNKSHAAAYAVVAVQTAYLKLYHPVEFMAALINSTTGNTGRIAYYIQVMRKRGIPILPPDVNLSSEKFTVDVLDGVKGLRFGLSGVKNLGHAAITAIVSEREQNGDFENLYDFIERLAGTQLNKKGVESLIRAGAFDSLKATRTSMLCVYERAMDGVSRRAKGMVEGQISLFGMVDDAVKPPPPVMPVIEEFELSEKLQMEREVTGIYISGHPLDDYSDTLSALEFNSQALSSLTEDEFGGGAAFDGRNIKLGGIIAERKLKATKSGNIMAFLQLEDMYGVTEVLVFPKVYERLAADITQDSPVIMRGKLSIREEEAPKLLLDSIERMRKDDERRVKLYLKLTPDLRAEVLKTLSETPGDIPVVLYMCDEKKAYAAPEEYSVSERYNAKRLMELLGADGVVLK